MSELNQEMHNAHRAGWLRAAVLGANDGLISTASLIIGVAAASAATGDILIAGVAGLIAGAMSMAAGEYVSVSSQSDLEQADLTMEAQELEDHPEFELNELAQTFIDRGVNEATAMDVATQLTAKDALAAHAREELGISEITVAKPLQAAFTSAITFVAGAAMPLQVVLWAPEQSLIWAVSISTLFFLAILGALGAKVGGASLGKGALRVMFWGALAMLATAAVGSLFGTVIG